MPLNSHRKFIESLGGTHAKVMLISRYVSFVKSVLKSSKLPAIFLLHRCLRDLGTVTGRNVNFIENELETEDILQLKPKEIKKKYKFCEINDEEKWKVEFMKEITNVKKNILKIAPGEEKFSDEELDAIVDFLVTS